MPNEELKLRVTAMFAEEAQERARALERRLLALEKSDAADRIGLIRALFRDAHSLKGAAGLVESRAIESACHWMEELFGAARDNRLGLEHAAIELLLAATDAIADSGRRLSGGDPEPGQLTDITRQLAAMASAMLPDIPAPSDDHEGPLSPSSQPTGQTGLDANDQVDNHSRAEALIRVPAKMLDTLLSQSGELLVARYRSRTRTDQITALQELTRRPRVRRMSLKGKEPCLESSRVLLHLPARSGAIHPSL